MLFDSLPNFLPFPDQGKDKTRKEYDFIVKHIKLVAYNGAEYDITLLRISLSIYEDLFNFCTSGEITLQDANDLPHLMPIIGEEKIKIKFTRFKPGNDPDKEEEIEEAIDVEYRIYKIGDRQMLKDKHQVYTLYFTQAEFITNLKTKLSRSFIDLPYSEMVKIAFEELKSDKEFVVEDTDFEHKYICPRITPMEMINTLACRSVSASGNGTTFFFFSDRDKFYYLSAGYLIDQPSQGEYTYQIKNVLENTDTTYKDRTIEQDLKSVEFFGHVANFDILQSLAQGHYASTLLTYDITRQKWEVIEFDYLKEFDSFKHLGSTMPHTENLDALGEPKSFMRFLATDKDHDIIPWIAGKEPGIKPNRVEEYTLYRYSQIKQLQGNTIRIQVSGDPRRKVGQNIDFILPQHMGNNSEERPEELDEYISGKYLITSIVHRLEYNKYIMEMEIIRDSFIKEPEHVDPLSKYNDVY